MNFKSNCFSEKKFRGRQEILEEYGTAWKWADSIQRKAIESLGDDDPICESLGYANIGFIPVCIYSLPIISDQEYGLIKYRQMNP